MIDYLEQLKKARTAGLPFPAFVQDTDIASVFRMLDPVGHGHISYSQIIIKHQPEKIKIEFHLKHFVKKRMFILDFSLLFILFLYFSRKTRLNELNATFYSQ